MYFAGSFLFCQEVNVLFMDSRKRFSNRVENYELYRPHYPHEVLEFLERQIGFNKNWVVADIGSGTGISSELFLMTGNQVRAVEPNQPMRLSAEKRFQACQTFQSVEGSAEETTLKGNSVDLIVAGQAFHWFNNAKAKREFQRISKKGAYLLLMWNEKQLATPFMRSYEKLLERYAINYSGVCQKNIDSKAIKSFFFPKSYITHQIPHRQLFTYDQLKGRLLSSSYAPLEDHPMHQKMLTQLEKIYQENKQEGAVSFEYFCRLFLGNIIS